MIRSRVEVPQGKNIQTTQNGQSNTLVFYSVRTCFGLEIDRHQARYTAIKRQVKMQ
jgi:hypothetical protein